MSTQYASETAAMRVASFQNTYAVGEAHSMGISLGIFRKLFTIFSLTRIS